MFFVVAGDRRELLQAHRARELVREVPADAAAAKDWRDLDDPAQRADDGGPLRPAGEALPQVLRQASFLFFFSSIYDYRCVCFCSMVDAALVFWTIDYTKLELLVGLWFVVGL